MTRSADGAAYARQFLAAAWDLFSNLSVWAMAISNTTTWTMVCHASTLKLKLAALMNVLSEVNRRNADD